MDPRIPYRHEVAAEVRAQMARLQINGATLAQRTNIPRATLHRRLNGASPFTIDELADIAEVLGRSVASFLPSHLATSA